MRKENEEERMDINMKRNLFICFTPAQFLLFVQAIDGTTTNDAFEIFNGETIKTCKQKKNIIID